MKIAQILNYLILFLLIAAVSCDDKIKIEDDDGDGISNEKDQCPNTLVGATVNEFGCNLNPQTGDTDQDGIPDERDECPNTPLLTEGLSVNNTGCLENTQISQDEPAELVEVDNQMIISGFSKYNEEQKNEIIEELKSEFGDNLQTCSCDEDILLWTLDSNIDLDKAIATAKSKGDEGLDGDKNYTFGLYQEIFNRGVVPNDVIQPILVEGMSDLPVVAILDSGLDIEQLGYAGLQLMNTENINEIINCTEITDASTTSGFGWNFADGNADMSTDEIAHGTNVTKTFISSLQGAALDEFQILPLKLFDENGRSSYWHMVCAFSYLSKIYGLGYDIALINTSFGGALSTLTDDDTEESDDLLVLKALIDSLDESLIVSSAGNNKSNNDNIPHFPGSYNSNIWFDSPSTNIVVVAGHDNKIEPSLFSDADIGSNFGVSTVDIAGQWHHTILEMGETPWGDPVDGLILKGTSFSTPIIGAHLLQHYLELGKSEKGVGLKDNFISNYSPIISATPLQSQIKDGNLIR
ncbi:S8 family serine peptidase [Pareuzebyella sediminis]|uniref:S8 family serine peptidase n=1 Tax=Pareuzebyella sediminis TaxID=2607998 RepID=UPI0018E1C0CF|nr:S8 family serine peptidase [Pareuzebyella sediminis]